MILEATEKFLISYSHHARTACLNFIRFIVREPNSCWDFSRTNLFIPFFPHVRRTHEVQRYSLRTVSAKFVLDETNGRLI